MARKSSRGYFNGFRQRTRVIVRRVRSYRPRKRNKTLLMVGAGAIVFFLFKDKILGMFSKK